MKLFQTIKHFFPILCAFKGYSLRKLKADAKAGSTVSLLDFPQGMAYALLAGFPVTFGIYASAIGSILGPIFASSRYLMLGPTNATAALILSAFLALGLPPEIAIIALPTLVLMVGVVLILGSVLRLAALTQYVSMSVVSGYITAAALLIIINQLDQATGLHIPREPTFFTAFSEIIKQVGVIQIPSVLISIFTALVYIALKKARPHWPNIILAILLSALLGSVMSQFKISVEFLDAFPPGHWPLSIPEFTFELISRLGATAFAIAFLVILESSSISKTLAAQSGERIDLNQQMLSLGFANCASAFGSGMTISGSLTRSSLNRASGAQTPLSSIISGTLLVIGVLLLGPFIGHIPTASLATIVIIVGCSLINIKHIGAIIKSTRSDATVFLVTFFSGLLFPLDQAIYIGAASSIILFLKKVSKPQLIAYSFNSHGELTEKTKGSGEPEIPGISIVYVEGDLFFGSSDIFLDQARLLYEDPSIKVIILRVRNAHHIDATSVMAIGDLARFAREKDRDLIISGAGHDFERVLKNSGIYDIIGENNFFPNKPKNPNLSTKEALKRAQEIIGQETANIHLFTAPHDTRSPLVKTVQKVTQPPFKKS